MSERFFTTLMAILIVFAGFLIGYRLGKRTADKWWQQHPAVIYKYIGFDYSKCTGDAPCFYGSEAPMIAALPQGTFCTDDDKVWWPARDEGHGKFTCYPEDRPK